jgi:hypothetical protein
MMKKKYGYIFGKKIKSNHEAVNEIIAVILLVAIVVSISTIMYTYLNTSTSAERTLLPVVFKAEYNEPTKTLTIKHRSGEIIYNALQKINNEFYWNDLIVKNNNNIITQDMIESLDVTGENEHLSPNEVITVVLKNPLTSGSKIIIIYSPNNQLIKAINV